MAKPKKKGGRQQPAGGEPVAGPAANAPTPPRAPEPAGVGEAPRRPRGRPRTSPLNPAEQNRERQRLRRQRLRREGLAEVEAVLPRSWREQLHQAGVNLREFIAEAVRRLMLERGLKPGNPSIPEPPTDRAGVRER